MPKEVDVTADVQKWIDATGVQKLVDDLVTAKVEKLSNMIEEDMNDHPNATGRMIHAVAWNKTLNLLSAKLIEINQDMR
jgi:hypothetical protein